MLSLKDFIKEEEDKGKYSDEHAHANLFNHMVKLGKGHDRDAINRELESAKTDENHPLHFKNVSSEGFPGKKKDEKHREAYHRELATAADTIHALHHHPDFKTAIKEKHVAKVLGAEKGKVSDTWKKHGATKGATSKADVSIVNPNDKTGSGLKLSMKKGAGSQLMSAGSEETNAAHDVAAREMLNHHPKYKDLSNKEKEEHHAHIMGKIKEVGKHVDAMKGASREQQQEHKKAGQAALDHVHDQYPELLHHLRKEAATGRGKFGEHSPMAASYLVKSTQGKKKANITHVDNVDFGNGPRPRVALPKGEGRPGNVKLDER